MKILWAKANKLLPVQSGGDIRSYHIARELAARHELSFFSYYDGRADLAYEQQLQEHFPNSVCLSSGKPEASTLVRALDYLAHLASPLPYAVSRFRSRGIAQRLDHWYQASAFDVVVADFLDAAVNFPPLLSIPSVLFQHNVESEIWRRHSLTEARPLKRRMYALEFRKMQRFEREAVRRFHHVIAVSEHDRTLMENWGEGARISVVPTGVDLSRFQPDFNANPGALVVFVGAMDWEPNIDAVEFFCRELWPQVQRHVPAARFRIVGRNPDRRVQALASESVEVTGSVPSVVEDLRQAAVVVVPLRIGGGTRLKIYEAMAMGKAVVSTSVGAEGLDVEDGRNIRLADDPQAFSAAVIEFLENPGLRARYQHAAAEAAAQYGWASVAERFSRVLEQVIGGEEPCGLTRLAPAIQA